MSALPGPRKRYLRPVLRNAVCTGARPRLPFLLCALARERMNVASLPEELRRAAESYQAWKSARGLADYTDLLERWLVALRSGETTPPWKHVLVDEVQDLSPLQLALLRALLPCDGAGFFGIGDPDQSI